ncbi:hypothetical protein BP6252_05480 [Coleophoma cylindrospora]|uniref:Methyltransferase domain-containing protein n=1 Tax=Coleophoma cylindrospora TaxID=1849047 RepID=A0A3D8RTK5_9HELO|nr:hypothetical protein BP6252_05480 [Coleophoma cylindrospora]
MDTNSPARLARIAEIYDKRAPGYDQESNFHPRQAADFLEWMELKPGHCALDLACGTGAVTIPSKRIVGQLGTVVGVDISNASLRIARQKAEIQHLDIAFIHHDVGSLDGTGLEQGTFDVITCAAAFVLLENPEAAVTDWSRYLKPGGKIIFDVLTKNTMIPNYLMDVVGTRMHIPLPFQRTLYSSQESVQKLLEGAGLDSSQSFLSESYESTLLEVNDAEEIYLTTIMRQNWAETVFSGFRDPQVQESAKEMFCDEFKKLADAEGKVHEERRFYMAVGVKKA